MSRKETQTQDVQPEKVRKDAPTEHPFSFPTIGNGITVMAVNQGEANEKAQRLQADMATQSLEKSDK